MTSKRQLMKAVETEAAALAHAVYTAGFWYEKKLQQTAETYERRQAQISAQAEVELARIQAVYRQRVDHLVIAGNRHQAAQEMDFSIISWAHTAWQIWQPAAPQAIPHLTRIGQLTEPGTWDSLSFPALLPIIGGRNLFIKATGAGKTTSRLFLQATMLRLLATLPPGKLRFICLDPVGLGSTMAGFIKGLPDILTGGQAWFDTVDIESHLANLEKHIANVRQKYLGHSFPDMEAYNTKAGEVAEPYRLLVVADFPARFSDSAAQRLLSIATNGPGAGVYLLAMVDIDRKLPYGFNLPDLERTAHVLSCDGSKATWHDPDFQGCHLDLDNPPSLALFEQIMKTVGPLATAASDVQVPFHKTAPQPATWWQGDTRAGLQVSIGRRGAQEQQLFELDEKLLSSALIIGRPGSGKSSLLHVLIVNLALHYSPDDMQLYLLDFKQVEFKDYATYALPHARVVAIQSEREFGLSVLEGLDAELRYRRDLFRDMSVDNLSEYRTETGRPMPRILLVADEFQELFSEDDPISIRSAQILDRLVRTGRAFGLNVLLASQTLAGSYSLSRATKDQIPLRIALQCADADSRLVLSDENDRARLLERPGEAIYNALNGRVEGNNLFQAFWLPNDQRESYLQQIRVETTRREWQPETPQIVFDGNAPAEVAANRDLARLLAAPGWPSGQRSAQLWLGEPLAIKPHTAAIMRRQSNSNLLIVGQHEHEPKALAMLLAAVVSLAAQQRPKEARFVLLNLTDVDADWHDLPAVLGNTLPHATTVVERRGVVSAIADVAAELARRASEDEGRWPALYLVVLGLQRHRDLRLPAGYYPMSETPQPPAVQLAEIAREGPDLGIHTLLWCDTYANLERVYDRNPDNLFALRVALQMKDEDSRRLLDTDLASKLGPYRAVYLDEERNSQPEKFRPYGLPTPAWLADQGKKLRSREHA